MPSPFPGMDPYLEAAGWGDVHNSLNYLAKRQIQRQLSGDLVARNEERVYIETEDELRVQHRVPDVRIVEDGMSDVPMRPTEGVAVAEPLVLQIDSDPITERFIKIIDVKSAGRVITIIEFISPSNKLYKSARESYLDKRAEAVSAGVSFVDIDLTREGNRGALLPQYRLGGSRDGDFMVGIYRSYVGSRGRNEVVPLRLREPLPGIRIPLRKDDPDVILDLGSLVQEAYEAGAYDRTIDYRKECEPPLTGDDAAWADHLLKAAGKR